jgi:hypothetical protein
VLAVATIVVLAAVGAGALFVGGPSGSGDAPGPIGGDGDGTTATTTAADGSDDSSGDDSSGSDGGSSAETTTDSTSTPYRFEIVNIEECGDTCRDVTATLTNTGQETRQNVRVTTEVYADDDLLWTGNETVGTLEPDESHTSTKRVKLSYWDGVKIKNNDGYVTIVTIIHSDSGTVRFEERRKVA